jgi:hypothetical protein
VPAEGSGADRTPGSGPLFTGEVSNPLPTFDPGPPAEAYWRGWPEVRADVRSSLRIVLVLALAGVPAGLAWWGLAPRADFRITEAGPEPVGTPSIELLVADDGVFVLVLAAVGLIAGAAAWRLRSRRGVATVVALAVGALASALIAWQLGELLGGSPTEEQIADVGRLVTTPLGLGSPAALAVGPFMAVLAYVVGALTAHDDGLGRTGGRPGPEEQLSSTDGSPFAGPERPLVDVPPGGPPA